MAEADRVSVVVAHFEQRILSGELTPGDLLPSERSISTDLGVSRSVVREALNRLASLGLVASKHGSGTRVEAPNSKPIAAGYQRLLRQGEFQMSHLAQVRLPLETTIAGLAALHRTDDHLARLRAAQDQLKGSRSTLETQVRADLEFHAVLAESTGNPLFAVVLVPIQELLIESRRRTLGRHGAELAYGHHEKILQAVADRDEAAAVQAMREHLEMNVQHLAQ